MTDSILDTTKKMLGLAEDYDVFDQEIIMHINSVLGTLNQLGIGPDAGFSITDNTATWDDFLGSDARFNPAKSYMYLRVRMLWDPPSIGYVLTAMDKQKEELEWRLNILRENIVHPAPDPVLPSDDDVFEDSIVIIDGGTP